jgi:O6-methylguanine-DNA--protein-cysteine methyltransferase
MAVRQLREYFAGTRRHFTVSLHLDGTPFQQQAWAEMQKIAYGDTISYAQQAARMKKPRAVRAVGSANGAVSSCGGQQRRPWGLCAGADDETSPVGD